MSKSAISRRRFLHGAVGAAATVATGGCLPRPEPENPWPGPLWHPDGALKTLDRESYLWNMEVLSELPGRWIGGGEPLMSVWARGPERFAASISGWVDMSDARNPQFASTPTNFMGSCVAYNTRLKKWLAVQSVDGPKSGSTPDHPLGVFDPKEQARLAEIDDFRGARVFDVTDPLNPQLLAEHTVGDNGPGGHMGFYDGGRYAYLDAGWTDALRTENAIAPSGQGLVILDLLDPSAPVEVARWHYPGSLESETEEYEKQWFAGSRSAWAAAHGAPTVPIRVEDGGRYGYGGFGHFGMVVFDLSEIAKPKMIGQVRSGLQGLGGIPFHTCLPVVSNDRFPQLANKIVALGEPLHPDCSEPPSLSCIVDVEDPTRPRIVGYLPKPTPPKDAPYDDFCMARGRVGYHNTTNWTATGTARPELVIVTAFNAGIRVLDISDPTQPKEVAWFVPPKGPDERLDDFRSWSRGQGETAVVEWDRNIIWLGTPHATYALSCPALGEPRTDPEPVASWTMPHLNRGWDG